MRRRIWKISEDRFDERKPEVDFSPEVIETSFLWNGEKEGLFSMKTREEEGIRGIVYSSSPYVQVLDPEFDGNDLKIRFSLTETEFYPGDEISGFFDVVYNQGEKRIPFRFTFHKNILQSSEGEITDFEAFIRLAQNNSLEALNLFYQQSFAAFMEDQDEEIRSIYRGFINAVPSAQNFENFMTAAGLKKPVDFEIRCDEKKSMV